MAWTTPRDWGADELVTATLMNAHVRDNLNYLASSRQYSIASTASQCSTASTSYVDVDGTNLALEITPISSRVLVVAFMRILVGDVAGNYGYFRLYCDNGIGASAHEARYYQGQQIDCMLIHPFTGLSAGTTYTFTPQYKGVTGTIYVNDQTYDTQYNAAVFGLEF